MDIRLNAGALAALEEAVKAAALTAMEAVRTEVTNAQVVPFDNGDLQGSMSVEPLHENGAAGARLITGGSDSPQARRLYFHPEYNFQTGNNPNARGEWLEPWLPGGEHESFAREALEHELKERLP
nr:MAG TPA: Minor capsid protein [Caudoviricetes sp.]